MPVCVSEIDGNSSLSNAGCLVPVLFFLPAGTMQTTKGSNRYKAELEGDKSLFSSAQEKKRKKMHHCVKCT